MTAPTLYTVSATVSGLSGQGLVLELNGGQELAVAADGTVAFPKGLASGSAYAVTVETQPAARRELCSVSNGSGMIGQANVSNVSIDCAIVVGFVYQTTGNNQLFSYGISSGTGALVQFGTPLAIGTNPTSMVATPAGTFIYVTTPIVASDPSGSGSVSVYAVDSDTGVLTAVSSVSTTGLDPTRLAVSPGGDFLFVMGPQALTDNSVLATYAIDATTGALTQTGTLLFGSAAPPDSIAVRPDGKFLYVMAGNFSSNTPSPETLTAYAIDAANGTLTAGPALTWMTTWNNTTNPDSMMAIDPLGRFLYLASEQGDTNQAAATVLPYAIDANTGALTPIGTGTPIASNAAQMRADPSGHYLYVLNSLNSNAANDTVLAMAIDQTTGVVSPLGSLLETPGAPLTLACDPSGQFVYVGLDTVASPDIAAYVINTNSSTAGQLSPSGQGGLAGDTRDLAIVE